ncbi:MAG: DsbA family protein [Pseudomonas sp.]
MPSGHLPALVTLVSLTELNMTATKQETRPARFRSFYWALGLIAIAGVGTLAWVTRTDSGATTAAITLPAIPREARSEISRSAHGVKNGADNAPVRLFVFSDFMCPACQHFTLRVEPLLRQEFVASGKVLIVHYDHPLADIHRWAFVAARAALCANDQGKFWPYHDRLFNVQKEWATEEKPPVETLNRYAGELGLDRSAFGRCLNSDQHAQLVTANYALGLTLGVRGTPTLIMNGRILGQEWQDYSLLRLRIEQELQALNPAAR